MKKTLDRFTFDHVIENVIPGDIRARIMGLTDVDQRRDFHPEGDVLKHTMIVTNRLAKYRCPELTFAGIMHDVGKDVTTAMSEKGFLQAIGHEDVSAEFVLQHKQFFDQFCDVEKLHTIVSQHMRVKLFEDMKEKKQAALLGMPGGGLLMLFREADKMSTLTVRELVSVGFGQDEATALLAYSSF